MKISRFLIASLALCALAGCEEPEPIETYRIPTEIPEQLLPGKSRMLAVMFAQDDEAWFVKVTGPEDAIKEIESPFRDFVTKLTFKAGKPILEPLPSGWNRAPNKPMRVATINVETESKQLDVGISRLPKREDWDTFVADNVNRWRGQLGLPDSKEDWAAGELIEIAADPSAIWVDIVGELPDKAAPMRPPFASSLPPAAPPPEPVEVQQSTDSGLQYDRPDGWRDGRMSVMRLAAFAVGPTEDEAEVTVIEAGGGLRENVDRWLGQVRGDDPPKEVVDQALRDAKRIKISGRAAQRFLLTGDDPESGDVIDATIVSLDQGSSMFIKMTGPAKTVAGQSKALDAFLESLQF